MEGKKMDVIMCFVNYRASTTSQIFEFDLTTELNIYGVGISRLSLWPPSAILNDPHLAA